MKRLLELFNIFDESKFNDLRDIIQITLDSNLNIESVVSVLKLNVNSDIKKIFLSNFKTDLNYTLDDCIKIVSETTNISIKQLKSKNRNREIVDARHVFCAIARNNSKKTLKEIGVFLKNRKHCTVINSIKQVENISALQKIYKIAEQKLRKKN